MIDIQLSCNVSGEAEMQLSYDDYPQLVAMLSAVIAEVADEECLPVTQLVVDLLHELKVPTSQMLDRSRSRLPLSGDTEAN